MLRARSDDQRARAIERAALGLDEVGGRLVVDALGLALDADDALVDGLHAETLGLLVHREHEVEAVHALGEARVVLDKVAIRDLTAEDAALEHHGAAPRAGRVEASGQAGRAATDDGDVQRDELGSCLGRCHRALPTPSTRRGVEGACCTSPDRAD